MTSETFTIRKATPADIPTIMHQRRHMFLDMGEADNERFNQALDLFAANLPAKMERGDHHYWLAEAADGRAAAGGGLRLIPWEPVPEDLSGRLAHIFNVYTEPDFRRRGLATRVMQAMLDWCRGEGIVLVTLNASPDGRPVYEKLGFQATNHMRIILQPTDG